MRTFIKGTSSGSKSRRDLGRAMGVRRIRRGNSNYRPRRGDVLINWGQYLEIYDDIVTWINHPDEVDGATNKTYCYQVWAANDIPTVDFTRDVAVAKRWVMQEEHVMHRALNRGSQGRGITICHDMDDVMHQYGGFFSRIFGDRKNKEYRIHVMDGTIIDTTQKRRRSRKNGYTGRFHRIIRSSANGWVFCREAIECPRLANSAAKAAVESLGLDFGAVDIAVSESGRVCVYEVNTAPGIEGTTLRRYSDALRRGVAARAGA